MLFVRMAKHTLKWGGGLQETIAKLIAGETVEVDTDGFQNDFSSFGTKDDVLTLLIHLGYLAYEEEYEGYGEDNDRPIGYARIPNEEIRIEFEKIIQKLKKCPAAMVLQM